MVRQWQNLFYENRLSGVDLVGNPDFVKLAESYGCKAFRMRRIGDVRARAGEGAGLDTTGPVVIDAEVAKEDNVFPMIPAGASIRDMILGPPRPSRAAQGPRMTRQRQPAEAGSSATSSACTWRTSSACSTGWPWSSPGAGSTSTASWSRRRTTRPSPT